MVIESSSNCHRIVIESSSNHASPIDFPHCLKQLRKGHHQIYFIGSSSYSRQLPIQLRQIQCELGYIPIVSGYTPKTSKNIETIVADSWGGTPDVWDSSIFPASFSPQRQAGIPHLHGRAQASLHLRSRASRADAPGDNRHQGDGNGFFGIINKDCLFHMGNHQSIGFMVFVFVFFGYSREKHL